MGRGGEVGRGEAGVGRGEGGVGGGKGGDNQGKHTTKLQAES